MLRLGYDDTYVSEPETHLGRSIFVPSADQVRMVKWVTGVQDSWGDKDDYYTRKQDGLSHFYGPGVSHGV
jgi:hypothetical protein